MHGSEMPELALPHRGQPVARTAQRDRKGAPSGTHSPRREERRKLTTARETTGGGRGIAFRAYLCPGSGGERTVPVRSARVAPSQHARSGFRACLPPAGGSPDAQGAAIREGERAAPLRWGLCRRSARSVPDRWSQGMIVNFRGRCAARPGLVPAGYVPVAKYGLTILIGSRRGRIQPPSRSRGRAPRPTARGVVHRAMRDPLPARISPPGC
jgi:hypothetical protein